MNKILIFTMLCTLGMTAQKRVSLEASASTLNIDRVLFVLDGSYRFTDRMTFSSWSSQVVGRRSQIDQNYFVSQNLFNLKSCSKKVTFSTGYLLFVNERGYEHSFVAKVNFKII